MEGKYGIERVDKATVIGVLSLLLTLVQIVLTIRAQPANQTGAVEISPSKTFVLGKRRAYILLGTIGVFMASAICLLYAYHAQFANLTFEQQEPIFGKTFLNETVDLDGKSFSDCKFVDVQLRFRGKASFSLVHDSFSGTILTSENPAVFSSWVLAKAVGLMPNVPVMGPDWNSMPNVSDPKIVH